jgi:hypothetical protein
MSNAGCELLLEAGAMQERTLEAVSSRPLLGKYVGDVLSAYGTAAFIITSASPAA